MTVAPSMPLRGFDLPLAEVIHMLVDAVCVVDVEGRFLFVSAAGEQLFGYTAEEMRSLRVMDLVHPDDRERTRAQMAHIVADTAEPHFHNRYVRRDGSTVHIMWTARWSPQKQVRVAVARDVTALRQAEMRQAALYAVAEASFAEDDLAALCAQVRTALLPLLPCRHFAVALRDVENGTIDFPCILTPDGPAAPPADAGATRAAQVVRSGLPLLEDAPAHHGCAADVSPAAAQWLGVPLATPEHGVVGALAVQREPDEPAYREDDVALLQFVGQQLAAAAIRRQAEARLAHMAHHDGLTGLPNRLRLDDRLAHALDRARRHGGGLSLLFIDLDRFKAVNDTLGHAAGDLLLRQVAQRLRTAVRASDTVGRLGGDEFLVLLESPDGASDPDAVADHLRTVLAPPFDLVGRCVHVGASIGIARYPDHGDDASALLRRADAAMYRAKRVPAGGPAEQPGLSP